MPGCEREWFVDLVSWRGNGLMVSFIVRLLVLNLMYIIVSFILIGGRREFARCLSPRAGEVASE